MSYNAELFSSDTGESESLTVKKWRMVSNHKNLLFMIAAGMIMPPQGFGGKYYIDSLVDYPGWIPLFPSFVPMAALAQATSERKHLISCVLEIDLSEISGPAKAVDSAGNVRDTMFPSGIDRDTAFILIPAPLPAMLIRTVYFKTKADKVECEKDASDFDNVPITDFQLRISATEFSKASSNPWPLNHSLAIERNSRLEEPMAMAGALTVLFHLANRNDLAKECLEIAFSQTVEKNLFTRHPILEGLSSWVQSGTVDTLDDSSAKMFWHIVIRLQLRRTIDENASALDVVLDELKIRSEALDDRARLAGTKLVDELKSLAGFSNSTFTELLDRHQKPLPRALLLLFLRESCVELISFEHKLLNDIDYIAAGILFGVREGWLGLPLSLREISSLASTIPLLMANVSHCISGSGFQSAAVPNRPKSLREIFLPQPWTRPQKNAALILARESGWDCISTRISLGRGQYKLLVDGAGAHILIDGEVKGVQTEVNHEDLLSSIERNQIDPKVDANVRYLLKD